MKKKTKQRKESNKKKNEGTKIMLKSGRGGKGKQNITTIR